jgi:hypothetical protein
VTPAALASAQLWNETAAVCTVVAAVDVSGAAAGGPVSTGPAIGRTCGSSVAATVVAAIVGPAMEAGVATVVRISAVVEELGTTVEVTSTASTWVAMVVAGVVATRTDLGVFATLITTMPITAAGIKTRFCFHQVRSGRLIGALAV